MEYLYGSFSDEQVKDVAKQMHNDIHKLLLYMDPTIEQKGFETNDEFMRYFKNTLVRFGGMNTLLKEPPKMPYFMSTLQAAYDALGNHPFNFKLYRKLIFDAHGYLTEMFGEVR